MKRFLDVRFGFGAVLFLAALVLLPGSAAACCTAVVCPFCVNSSSSCVCGSNQPVCNVFGCNCNNQCGAYSFNNNGLCYFYTPCDAASAKEGAQARFNQVDTNKDGKISKDEAWVWAQAQKRPLIANKSELPANLTAPGAKPQDVVSYGFKNADTNGDGSITPAEFDSSLGTAKK